MLCASKCIHSLQHFCLHLQIGWHVDAWLVYCTIDACHWHATYAVELITISSVCLGSFIPVTFLIPVIQPSVLSTQTQMASESSMHESFKCMFAFSTMWASIWYQFNLWALHKTIMLYSVSGLSVSGLVVGMHYMAPLLQLSPNPNWTQLCAKCPCYVPWPLIWRAWCTCSHTLDFSLKMADKYMHKLCIAHAMQCTDQCDFCINVNDLCVYFQILSICSTASTVTSVRFCVVLLTTSVVQGVLQTVSEAINSLICGDSTDMTANSKQSVNES